MRIEIRNKSVILDGYVNAVARDSKPMLDENGEKFVEQITPKAFERAIEKAGYYVMIYTNLNWLKSYLYADELLKCFDLWLAEWDTDKTAYSCGIWQYSSTGKTKNYFEYTIQKGDTLWDLAKKYLGNGARYKEIKLLNNFSSDTIYTGQTLKIPK